MTPWYTLRRRRAPLSELEDSFTEEMNASAPKHFRYPSRKMQQLIGLAARIVGHFWNSGGKHERFGNHTD